MNRYVIIRSDTKSISHPISKTEAIKRLKQYDKDGISTYLVYKDKYLDFDCSDRRNICK